MNFLSGVSIKTKMVLAFVFLGLLTIIPNYIIYSALSTMDTEMAELGEDYMPSVIVLKDMQKAILQIDDIDNSLLAENLTIAERQELYKLLDKEPIPELEKGKKFLEKTPRGSEEEKLWQDYLKAIDAYLEKNKEYLALSKEYEKNKTKEVYNQLSDFGLKTITPFYDKATELMDKIADINEADANKSYKLVDEEGMQLKSLIIYTSVAFLIFAAFFGYFIAIVINNGIVGPIKLIASSLQESIAKSSETSEEMANASQKIAEGSSEQASSLEETAATLEELNSMTQKNTHNSKRSAEITNNAEAQAKQGKIAVEKVLVSMQSIEQSNTSIMNQVKESNHKISEIVKIINDIANKTKVINEIVFQTKLLSFNASVEAARAGEYGKGFAVVAEEVGNLAQMSGTAAKEIEQMLQSSIDKVENIVSDTKTKVELLILEGKVKVEDGKKMVDICSSVLTEIVNNTSDSAVMANEIAKASEEQASGINQISTAVTQLDIVTQENASMSQETANASDRLAEQGQELQRLIIELIAVIEGKSKQDGYEAAGRTTFVSKKPRHTGSVNKFKVAGNKNKAKTADKSYKSNNSAHSLFDSESPQSAHGGHGNNASTGNSVPDADDIRFAS